MIIFLIGHRGSGKTSLLSRIQNTHFVQDQALDLDTEIKKLARHSIEEIFASEGESGFRQWEQKTLREILQTHISRPQERLWIALGAGCGLDFTKLPTNKFLWVKRTTDFRGRIFLDRPLLDNGQSAPLDDFLKRFPEREEKYANFADLTYEIPEGLGFLPSGEKDLALEKVLLDSLAMGNEVRLAESVANSVKQTRVKSSNPIITITQFGKSILWPQNLPRPYFEWRDDRLSPTSLRNLGAGDLFSSRKEGRPICNDLATQKHIEWDWALELGPPPTSGGRHPSILSLHVRKDSLEETLADFDRECKKIVCQQKLAVEILNFAELRRVWVWQQESPENRSIVPRTLQISSPHQARWCWFRLYMKGRQKIHFISSGDRSAADQASISQWLATPDAPKKFAAILGDPTFHSFSPEMHRNFFAQKGMPFWAIPIPPAEMREAFTFLQELGLVAAAVTSPLKDSVGGNTWWLAHSQANIENTDVLGLREEFAGIMKGQESVAVFGGGGTLKSLSTLLPNAHFISQRTGQPRESSKETLTRKSYDISVWAAGPEVEPPPWKSEVIFDLNYREDSRAREWALLTGARYVSGLGLFVRQALEQQKLWRSL